MNDTDYEKEARPHAAEMAAGDPALFSPLTVDEVDVLRAHLGSGWAKQAVVYPVLAEAWRETSILLDDLHVAWNAAFRAEHPDPEAEAEATP
ncbi:MAG: hypothetical protein J2P25_06795 [Nocardiopsaceae bacterium]|nr:hypothetical protein [Nocardiopsaceae bacterium]